MTSSFVKSSDQSGVRIIEIALPDSIDHVEFENLNDSIRDAVDSQKKIIIDLAGTRYVGSAILGLLVNVRQIVKQNTGRLALCCLSPRLLEIFQTSSLEKLFTVATSRADALRAVS
jgi:anti-anti-sigma factor